MISPGLTPSHAQTQTATPGGGAPSPRGALARTWEETFKRMHPFTGKRTPGADPATLDGKIICGYQGWFLAPGDGSGRSWVHYGPGKFAPGAVTVEMWPDMTEATADERYPTDFCTADGSVATVFSSYNAKTVDRHMKWMEDYGIDGAFLQRFANGVKSPEGCDHLNAILDNVRQGANRHGRTWAVMYDLSGMQAGEIEKVLMEDWRNLHNRMEITRDPSYQHHNGKPLVVIWGIGFDDKRKYTLDECAKLIDFLKNDPTYGGNSVMLGVPYAWRDLNRDTVSDPKLHEVIRSADIVSPWTVGRYGTSAQFAADAPRYPAKDLAWCEENKLAYMPVIFPGFRWKNLMKTRGKDTGEGISRNKGEFFQKQGEGLIALGVKMIYIAMFDEIDEGTAIFKCSNQPPAGETKFLTLEGLPPDHYLRLAGEMGAALRKSLAQQQKTAPASK